MEKGVRKTLAVLLLSGAAAGRTQEQPAKWIEEFESRFPPVEKNAAAEDLETLGVLLGFDPKETDSDEHPTKADREALLNAGHGSWLDAQIATSDDSIATPPPRFVEFLETKRSSLWRVVGLLEREIPEWGFDMHRSRSHLKELLFLAHLNRLLLAAALVEERVGRHAYAADLLEAAWSLYRSVALRPELIFQLIAVSTERSQAGVLRKTSEPGPEWIERMASREPLRRLMESIRYDSVIHRSQGGELTAESADSLWTRLPRAVAERLEPRSACEISRLSSDEIFQPAIEELSRWIPDQQRVELQVVSEAIPQSLTSALHRAARLVVECELTARILELRQEKAASRSSRWPEKFFDTDSRVCPGSVYEYRSVGGGMSIRFKGAVGDLEAQARPLPLSFEARALKPLPPITSTRHSSPTPTGKPPLTPRKPGA
jgi:hypothetical protein